MEKRTKNWKKILGMVAIISTIVAGIAVAPDAVANIEKAYQSAVEIVSGRFMSEKGETESKDDTAKLISI